MKIHEYTRECIEFAHATESWGNLSPFNYYTTRGNGWSESCDNDGGGIDVSWAFRKSDEFIKESAPQEFVDRIADLLRLGVDDEWDADQFSSILSYIE